VRRQHEGLQSLPPDLQQAVAIACESIYNPVWTEYSTKHALALKQMVAEQGVQVRKLPDDVIVAMGNAAGEVINDLRNDSDELVRRIVESYLSLSGLDFRIHGLRRQRHDERPGTQIQILTTFLRFARP
jgi:TRAP-type mannitol/chloroaromatic compound transport system substrate-binding protein